MATASHFLQKVIILFMVQKIQRRPGAIYCYEFGRGEKSEQIRTQGTDECVVR